MDSIFGSYVVTRNKLAMEAKVLRHPSDLVFKLSMFLQMWAGLSKARDREALQAMASELKAIYFVLVPNPSH